jgi:hypothetical protein
MEDKKQDVNSLQELVKEANAYSGWFANLADELSKVLADIKAPEKEEDTWEMKFPFKYWDECWFVLNDGDIKRKMWGCSMEDVDRFNIGNVFPTEEAAKIEVKSRNLLTRFRAFRDECNDGWKPDWKNHRDRKYFISLVEGGKLVIFNTGTVNHFCLFGYFKNSKDAERAIDLFGDEIKALFVDCEVQ